METLSSHQAESWLSWFLRGVLILSFLILFSRLFEIQIIKGSYFRSLSEENRIRHVPIPAPRGKILARNGEVLVGNIEVKKKIDFDDKGVPTLSEDLGASDEETIIDYKRYYYLGDKFAHASGYVGAPAEDQILKIDPNCPEKGPRRPDVWVGKGGLELSYDCLLSGIPGEELVEVDTNGVRLRSLGRREPTPGRDLITAVDIDLQSSVAASMKDQKGAAIVTDIKGKILAFYSGPSFDPNLLVTKTDKNSSTNSELDNQKITQLFTDTNLPFFNRVIGGTFHPGSVFKPITALAALEEGVIESDYTYNDTGSITVNEFSYTNWYFTQYGKTEGLIDLPKAIARSTDTFFYKIGELAGPEAINKWSSIFDLDKPTGIDIEGEVAGLIPSPEWKKKVKKENWYLGNTYHMSIGQGDIAVTPAEINRYIAAIASNGTICKPSFLGGGNNTCRNIDVNYDHLNLVIEGMKQACSVGGTAYTFFDFSQKHGETDVACKTGTAEVGVGDDTHAWFTVFAPIQSPQIVATILIEKGGQGSEVAGPIAREIFDYYFSGARTQTQ